MLCFLFIELVQLGQACQAAREREDFAVDKYLKLSTRVENESTRVQLSEEVFSCKKKLHEVKKKKENEKKFKFKFETIRLIFFKIRFRIYAFSLIFFVRLRSATFLH
jgi:hypothetical protein